jgi:hypothetical protein
MWAEERGMAIVPSGCVFLEIGHSDNDKRAEYDLLWKE